MRVGILGGGQLARMLALAARPMGIKTLSFTSEITPTIQGVSEVFLGDLNEAGKLEEFARQVDVMTYETENIPVAVVDRLKALEAKKICCLAPSAHILEIAQDRLQEKNLFQQLNIETPRFASVETREELIAAVEGIGLPAVLKTRRFGYDGKGQFVLITPNDLEKAWEALGAQTPLILEQYLSFNSEVSLIAVRNRQGKSIFYPLTKNIHAEGILRVSTVVPPIDASLQQLAQHYLQHLLDHLDYCGVLVVEFFLCGEKLIANEMAPRVHNSGHWTIEGAATSQFENHIRAICNLPLGSTETTGYHAMFNCIGTEPALETILSIPNAHFHTYEKIPRPQRKLGHVTLSTADPRNYEKQLAKLQAFLR